MLKAEGKTIKKVAIYGTAANPIHIGHVAIVQEVAKHFDEVWLSPCYIHKFSKKLIDGQARLTMCKLALKNIPNVVLSDIEIKQKWEYGTYDMLSKMKDMFNNIEFHFVIGQDNANNIKKWQHWEKLIAEFGFVVLPRLSLPLQSWYSQAPHLYLENFKPINVNSTNIRNMISNSDESVQTCLHPDVLEFIKEHELYQ